MPMQAPTAPTDKTASEKKEAPALLVPFTQASDERIVSASIDVQALLGASTTDSGSLEITSYGWAKGIWLRVTTSGGAAGLNNAVLAEDGPFSALANIRLTEPNGREFINLARGYNAFLMNKYGGYWPQYCNDPRSDPGYTAGGTGGNFAFWLWLPFEMNGRSAMGAQSNMDDSGQLKLQFNFNVASQVYSTQPDTKPTMRVRGYLSAWNPVAAGADGRMNAQTPPAPGVTQYWTAQQGLTVNAGETEIRLKRKGLWFRTMIFVLRRAGTSRANGETDWADETRWIVDEFTQQFLQDDLWLLRMYKWFCYGAAGVTADTARGHENGVRILSFAHEFDGAHGNELRDRYKGTLGTTSLRIEGSFGTAGTLDVVTNDIAIPQGMEQVVFNR